MYSEQEVKEKTLEYFKGDTLACSVWMGKYALKNKEGQFLELTPDDMHKRLAKEFARIEANYPNPLLEEDIYNLFKGFKYIIPQGSPMFGIGNEHSLSSLSNCYVVGTNNDSDSYGSIMRTDEEIAQIYKRRGGCGLSLDHYRPTGSLANGDILKQDAGSTLYMERFSNTTREVAQCLHEDTLILTKKGLKKIKDVFVGDFVWTKRGWIKVEKVLKNKKSLVEVKTKFGKSIKCSKDHVFHSIDGENKISDLGKNITSIVGEGWEGEDTILSIFDYEKSDYNNSNRLNENVILPQTIDKNLSYFLGYFYANGCVEDKNISISIPCNIKGLEEKLLTIIKDSFNIVPSVVDNKTWKTITIHSKLIRHHLEMNGLLKNKADKLILPEYLKTSKKSVLFSFISGYFDADGTIIKTKKTYRFSSVSKNILNDFQIMLMSFGVVSRMSFEDRSHIENWNDIYSLSITSNKSQKIFFNLLKESKKIENIGYCFDKNSDNVRTVYKAKDFNSSASKHKYLIDDNQFVSYSTTERLKKDLNIKNNDFILIQDYIESIKEIDGVYDVYDLCLSSEHLFFANGLYAHNSGRRGALMETMSIKHPDAETFIDKKLQLGKVTGANISVKLTDEFMNAVKNDLDFIQTFPINLIYDSIKIDIEDFNYNELNSVFCKGKEGYIKKIKARELWNKIIKNAHQSAEPGLLFWDNILKESPAGVYGEGWKEISTNPCFTGDTIIAVADGRNGVAIKDLAEFGKEFIVYSGRLNKSTGNNDGGWKPEIKKAKAFKTGTKNIVKIELSDGSCFRCTPDHRLALPCGDYIEAKDSLGLRLEKFYSFSNKNNEKSYRHINSKTNGYSKQYRLLWEYYNGKYDGKLFNIDHKDDDSKNDSIDNLQLLSLKEHKEKTKRFGKDNPIHKITGSEYLKMYTKRSSIQANGIKYDWNQEEIDNKVLEFDLKYRSELDRLRPKDINVDLSEDVFVESIIEEGFEDVYDLTVEDNHNFYIVTKADDDKFLNSSGVLVHNCSELPLCEYDSCRLIAINLYSYVDNPFTPQAKFNFKKFKDHVNKAQRLMDDLIDLEIEKLNKIISKIENDPESEDIKSVELNLWRKIKQKAIEGRRTGLGITAEGDMLAALNLTYGTKEAIDFSEEVHKVLAVESYKSSIDMAKERGSFPIWDYNKELRINPFINRIIDHIFIEEDYVYRDYMKHGRRNIANLTIAPTGSVSILSQTTSGLEPVFQIYYKRRKKTEDKSKAIFIDEVGDMWEEYPVFHHKFIKWFIVNLENIVMPVPIIGVHCFKSACSWLSKLSNNSIDFLLKQSPYYKATSADVDYMGKVEMQGKIQKWIDHSISVTVNVPENTTIETVNDIYLKAHEVGCKGITIYREGSRSGVLISDSKKETKESEQVIYNDAIKRPERLICDILNITRGKQPYTIIVGKLNDKPYEIFVLEKLSNTDFDDSIKEGTITKVKSKTYQLDGKTKEERFFRINNIVDHMSSDEQKDTRKYSLMLRHGIKPKYIIEQIEEYATITSFDKVIAKVLSNYLNGEKVKGEKTCPTCNSTNIKNETGCLTCQDCGWSKCG